MEPTTSPWNSLEFTKLFVSGLIPLIITVFGFLFSRRLGEIESKRQHEIEEKKSAQAEAEKRQKKKDQIEHEDRISKFTPHIQFEIDCNFFGPHNGKFAAEFILTANNRGITKHNFESIILRVRGIKEKEKLFLWKPLYPCRLKFPIEILKDDVIPYDLEYYFVEPGVCQRFNYITIIEKDVRFITARAEFMYTHKNYKPHTAERMFELPS